MPEVGDVIKAENARWRFSGNQTTELAEHIEKSIPGYTEGHKLTLQLSDFFIRQNSRVYDLGCTTGVLTQSIATRHADANIEVIGVDRELSLIAAAREKVPDPLKGNLKYETKDIINLNLASSDFIISYYTLQFVTLAERRNVLDKIWKSLNPGGAFLLFEKTRETSSRFQDIMTLLYNDFKLGNGYSGNEIIAKARSLKGVLEPLSSIENIQALKKVGFKEICPVCKNLCFEGYLAIKN
ncbi:MAG: methyltransferase domain-containing protein [Pseudomonadota bacterium]|nr:methyltransferase domain-containing protein [Pseudomonadota bacterium]